MELQKPTRARERMKSRFIKRGDRVELEFGFSLAQGSLPQDSRLSRQETLELIREDLAKGGFELGKIEYDDESRLPRFITIKFPDGTYGIVSVPYIPVKGWHLPESAERCYLLPLPGILV